MFSKAKRFDPVSTKNASKEDKKTELTTKDTKRGMPVSKTKNYISANSLKSNSANSDVQSQCSSTQVSKPFLTPKPLKRATVAKGMSTEKLPPANVLKCNKESKISQDIIAAQEVEIRNKDVTIVEYSQQIEDLKNEIAVLQSKIQHCEDNKLKCNNDLHKEMSQMTLNETEKIVSNEVLNLRTKEWHDLTNQLISLEQQCETFQQELSTKQVELSSLEEIIHIRDSLCKDLQNKLTNVENTLDETCQRLEMVKGHHSRALEANESIRKEYKTEIETLKSKLEDEKQALITKYKSEQEKIKSDYKSCIEFLQKQLQKEKEDVVVELNQVIKNKEREMKAKLEQMEEATHEKLRLCEIQFEERSRDAQKHWTQQCEKFKYTEKELAELKFTYKLTEEQTMTLQKEINYLITKNNSLQDEKTNLIKQIQDLKDEPKVNVIDYENEINRLTVKLDMALKEKVKFETSLTVTRDIVQVLTMRLRESDNDVEHLEAKVQALNIVKQNVEEELVTCKSKLNNTLLECSEYKEALVNILKSKAALAKEHTRIMEHNVSLIESLQNVEREAYRELGSIKNELIDDVEILKKESNSQIQTLRQEVEKKRVLCEMATEHAGQATAAAEQSRQLLARAAQELARLEADNQRLQHQIQDQQSLVVELSLLRQENEELTMTVAKQSSVMDKLKKDLELQQTPKSPSMHRKTHKVGKENTPIIISPLRERNH